MNKKKTLIIVIASALVVIIGIVAVVLALRGKDKNEVVDATTTTESVGETTTIDPTLEPTLEVIGTSPNKETENDAPTDAPTDANKETEKETEPSDEGEKETEPSGEGERETEPVIDVLPEGTLAPTVAPTIPPTVAPTEPQTEAPTPAPTEPPTEAPKPLTEKDKFLNCGGTYVANSDGTVTVNYANVKGDVVIPNTIDGKKVVVEYADRWKDTTITSLYIDAEVIPEGAFNGCNGLVSVTIGPNVKTLGDYTFASCSNLETITFEGEGITEIPKQFATDCPKMTSLTLPRSVTKLYLYCITSASYYESQIYKGARPQVIDYASFVPAFTLYTYSEPGEILVWEYLYDEYVEYPEGLEVIGTDIRKVNFTVVYLD